VLLPLELSAWDLSLADVNQQRSQVRNSSLIQVFFKGTPPAGLGCAAATEPQKLPRSTTSVDTSNRLPGWRSPGFNPRLFLPDSLPFLRGNALFPCFFVASISGFNCMSNVALTTPLRSFRYGFMFGKESARKELADKINELKATIQKLESHDNV